MLKINYTFLFLFTSLFFNSGNVLRASFSPPNSSLNNQQNKPSSCTINSNLEHNNALLENDNPTTDGAIDIEQKILKKERRRKFDCSMCLEGGFYTEGELKEHERQNHSVSPPVIHSPKKVKEQIFECNICNKSFQSNRKKRIHYTNSHTSQREFKCVICYKTLSSESTFKNHLKNHNRKKPYQCSQCPKSFATKSVLKRHMNTHI